MISKEINDALQNTNIWILVRPIMEFATPLRMILFLWWFFSQKSKWILFLTNLSARNTFATTLTLVLEDAQCFISSWKIFSVSSDTTQANLWVRHSVFFVNLPLKVISGKTQCSQFQRGIEVTDTNNYAWRNYGSIVLVITLGVSIVLLLVSNMYYYIQQGREKYWTTWP